jgi:hypothetical protein
VFSRAHVCAIKSSGAPWFHVVARRGFTATSTRHCGKPPDERRMNAKPRALKAEFLNQP